MLVFIVIYFYLIPYKLGFKESRQSWQVFWLTECSKMKYSGSQKFQSWYGFELAFLTHSYDCGEWKAR